ncbi:Maf family protein [Tindallia californiensis]|uniref:dTTP/UTP pyrophosphatase n=1 Tax=Tindallia californiensis TaxID=159292 RepID=A0A1H3IKH4_9FIRM|nr:Maf family protein [Tindallia californiensis]SDY27578.1 septum formation protein [Tindallia californiensis]
MKLILASQSPRRQEILSKLKIVHSVEKSDVNENEIIEKNACRSISERIRLLSYEKANEVAKKHWNEKKLVLGADTVVVQSNIIYGKPNNEEEMKEMLAAFSGKMHQVMTAVTMINTSTCQAETTVECTKVLFRLLNEQEMDWYLKNAHYDDKAGGYAIQEEGALLVKSIEGCYYNVVGLPIHATLRLFERFQLSLTDFQEQEID